MALKESNKNRNKSSSVDTSLGIDELEKEELAQVRFDIEQFIGFYKRPSKEPKKYITNDIFVWGFIVCFILTFLIFI